ncbi:MAG: 4Fe-4S dicluster domain-containing protein [Nitrososphaeria archaeon]|nr:4Fe-4S dicluster domain-containing protein [Nitrososphaeria archaeon]NIN52961.1 4Fe-4S dicluster domain-containing protein [Nitrososphaeria archaeon]
MVENKEFLKCKSCGFCKVGCPVSKAKDYLESVSPRGKMLLLLGLQRGDLKVTPRLAEKFFTCVLCAHCTQECPSGMQVHEILIDSRKGLKDYVPAAVKLLRDNLAKSDNPFGLPDSLKTQWTEGSRRSKANRTILYTTCSYPYMRYGEALTSVLHSLEKLGLSPNQVSSLVGRAGGLGRSLMNLYSRLAAGTDVYTPALVGATQVLEAIGVESGHLYEEEPCCGYFLYIWGFDEDFSEHANKTYKKLKSLGVERLISMTPSCTEALSDIYPRYVDGYDLKVQHFVETVKEGIEERKIKLKVEEPLEVTFHDPCQLARYLKFSSYIRDILQSIEGLTLVEATPNTGLMTKCCGGGGSYEVIDPDLSIRIAVDRARELVDTGVQTIVTCCPACLMNLRRGIKELGAVAKVVDLAELLSHALTP